MIRRWDIAIWFFKDGGRHIYHKLANARVSSHKSYTLSIPRGQAQLSRVIHAGGIHMWTHRAPRFPDHSLDCFPPVRPKVQCPWPPTSEAGPLSVCVTCTRRDPSASAPDILRKIPSPLPVRPNSASLTEETHTLPYATPWTLTLWPTLHRAVSQC